MAISTLNLDEITCTLERPHPDGHYGRDCCHIQIIENMEDCCPVACPMADSTFECKSMNISQLDHGICGACKYLVAPVVFERVIFVHFRSLVCVCVSVCVGPGMLQPFPCAAPPRYSPRHVLIEWRRKAAEGIRREASNSILKLSGHYGDN